MERGGERKRERERVERKGWGEGIWRNIGTFFVFVIEMIVDLGLDLDLDFFSSQFCCGWVAIVVSEWNSSSFTSTVTKKCAQ